VRALFPFREILFCGFEYSLETDKILVRVAEPMPDEVVEDMLTALRDVLGARRSAAFCRLICEFLTDHFPSDAE
jgi:hypothetical protein